MDWLLIGDTKMKIMMNGGDMAKYRLNARTVDYADRKTRRTFWKILDEAKEKTGFDAAGDRILLQMYPSQDGGCELFVTKLGKLPAPTEKALSHSENVGMLSSRRAVYRFSLLSDLCDAARVLSAAEASVPQSDVYLGEDGAYYLVLEERDAGKTPSGPAVCEWGDIMPAQTATYQREHGVCLCQGDALRQFSLLA